MANSPEHSDGRPALPDQLRLAEAAAPIDVSDVLNAFDHSVFVLDSDDRIVCHNDCFLKTWDLAPEEVQGQPDLTELLVHLFLTGRYGPVPGITDEDAFRLFLDERFAGLRRPEIEPFELRRNGRVYQATGKWAGEHRVIHHVDVTVMHDALAEAEASPKAAQAALCEAEDAKRAAEVEGDLIGELFQSLPHGAVLLDENLHVLQYNRLFLNIAGVTDTEIAAYPRYDRFLEHAWRTGRYMTQIGPDREDEFRAFFETRLEELRQRKFRPKEVRITFTDDQKERVFLTESVSVGNGQMITYVDVTSLEEARDNAEKAGAVAEETRRIAETDRRRLAEIFKALPYSAVLLDRDLKVTHYNDRFLDALDLKPEDARGQPFYEDLLVHSWTSKRYNIEWGEETANDKAARLEKRRVTLRQRRCDPVKVRRKDVESGALTVFLVEAVPVGDGQMITQVDITAIEEARLSAESADKAKSAFLANMSHEIRTPMNGIVGMCEILSATEMTDEQRLCTRTISDSSAALLNIINDILDFSKIEADKLTLRSDTFSLHDAVYDVATLFAGEAGRKGLEVCIDYEHDVPRGFLGDVGRIRQVLVNIAGNAVKFTEAGYVLLRVSHDAETGQTQIAIQDTGVGIPEQKISKIFSAFEQVDNQSTRHFTGTGLGLAITQRLVRMMGGEISVTSRLGKGSVFTVDLDLEVAEVSPGSVLQGDISGLTVLAVDDLDVNRTILRKRLGRIDAKVLLADSAEDARELVCSGGPIDIGIFDLHMPLENGADLMRSLVAERRDPLFPVILLSSMDQSWNKSEMMALGFSDVLVKPVRDDLLMSTMVRLLKRGAGSEESQTPVSLAEGAVLDLSGHQILVAEDNKTNRLVLTKMLDPTGVDLHVTHDGQQALEHYRDRRPDMVLMDISMPVLNGLEATAAIRAHEEATGLDRCPIIALTANAMQHHVDQALDAGMDDFLSKPLRKGELLDVMVKWLYRELTGTAGQ